MPLLLSCGAGQRVNLVLIIVDTVSARHVGYCGYERNTTPVLDSLSRTGAAFTACQAQAPWTLPAGATILSGLNPRSHGARRYEDGQVRGADPAMPTIATVLHGSGYSTAAFINNYLLGEEFGWHTGYDHFYSEYMGLKNSGPTVDSCLVWIRARNEDENFFALVHLFDAHDPYDPPAPFDTLFGEGGPPFNWNTSETGLPPDPSLRQHLVDNYDGEIAHIDHEMGRLFAGLREMGLSDNTIVVVVADHGEEFLERGQVWHGKSLHQELLHVPLVISGPGIPVGIISRMVGQVDIAPTIMGVMGLDWPGQSEGENLFDPDRHLPVFSSNLNSGPLWPVCGVQNGMKVIWSSTEDEWVAFDLRNDPEGDDPVEPDSALKESVLQYWATPVLYTPSAVDQSRVDAILRDLGYI